MSSTIGKSANFGLPTVAVTIGDPAGIGPEVCLKLLANPEIQSRCRLVILGGYSILQTHSKLLRLPFTTVKIDDISKIESAPSNVVLNIETKDFDKIRLGEVSPESGEAAFNYLQSAMDLAKRNLIDAIVTGPINKLSFNAAGVRFPGHTELFASSFGVENFCMMQYSRLITCSFVTTHVGYQDVVQRLSVERIGNVIRLTHDALNKINGAAPRLVVCGLNPHAGEEGLFGHREEENIIQPAIVKCRSEGMTIEGPLPPDTCFIPAKRETTDGYICMYHDQGHIPLKAIAFDQAVNTTLGLPVIRTSVDHGTAFDIVGKNLADPGSMIAAVQLATQLVGVKGSDKIRFDAADPRDTHKRSTTNKPQSFNES